MDIIIGETGDELCLVKALGSYLHIRDNKPGPLFVNQNCTPFTKQLFTKAIQDDLVAIDYENCSSHSGHSFWSGATTTAAAMQVKDSVIKCLGR